MISRCRPRAVASQYYRRTVERRYHHIRLSIVVQIAKRRATSGQRVAERRPGAGRNIYKTFAGVQHQQRRLFVFQIWIRLFNSIEHVTLRDEEIAQPIVVGVDEMRAPTRVEQGNLADAGGVRRVIKVEDALG